MVEEIEKETLRPLTDKEKLFADSYLIHLQKNRAALDAGCPLQASRQQGYEIYNKPNVKAYIEEKLRERTISAEETIKLISDTAQSSVTDYFKSVQVPYTPKIKVPLLQIINERKEGISQEREFISRAGIMGEEYDRCVAGIDMSERDIMRLIIELERNPDAYRVVDGPTIMVEDMQLDIPALVADREKGKVKKIKVTKDGAVEIEMYSATEAQDKLMKMYGKYEKDNEQSKTVVSISGMEIK